MEKQSSPYWSERLINYLDEHFDKGKTIFEFALMVAMLIIPFTLNAFFSLPPKRPGGDIMSDPVLSPAGIVSMILLYTIIFCMWMLYRNNARSAKASRLREEKMILLLEAIAKKMGADIEVLPDNIRQQKQSAHMPPEEPANRGK
jgi:hypothetical protein